MGIARLKKSMLAVALAASAGLPYAYSQQASLPSMRSGVYGTFTDSNDHSEEVVQAEVESSVDSVSYVEPGANVEPGTYVDSGAYVVSGAYGNAEFDSLDSQVIPASHSTRGQSLFSRHQPTSCDAAGTCDPCVPWWAHRSGGFGELLYLNAGNSDLIYAVEQTSVLPNASPTGPLGIANIGQELGYRFGFSHALSNCSSLVASYTRWDGDTFSSIEATGTNVLNSQLIHPSVATTGAASLEATARQKINFQYVDVMVRRVHRAYDCGVINWNAGLRYGKLEQGVVGNQTVSVATGLTTVTTDVDFDGLGIIAGLDGERHARDCGLFVYGKAMGSLLAGNWQADYTQVNQFGGGVIANKYQDFRISPVTDTELGLGWQSCGGRFRVSSGYLFSCWFNAVNNRDYINGVRTSKLLELDNSVTFSGLALRSELRF